MGKHGQYNYKGINAQSWAAMSLLLQYMIFSDFEGIEFESENLEDFTLIFSNSTKLICESKNRDKSFAYSQLRELLKSLIKKGEITKKDKILIVTNNVSEKLLSAIKNFSYLPEKYKQIFLDNRFEDEHLSYLNNLEFWVADFSEDEGKESALAIFTGLLDFGITESSLEGLFYKIMVEEVYHGSEKGKFFSRKDFYKVLDEFKKQSIKDTGRYDDDYKTIDTQLSQLIVTSEQLKKAQRPDDFAPKILEALSTKPNLMSYILNKLEQLDSIDLEIIKPILNLNITFRYSNKVLKILINNIAHGNNAESILSYLEEKSKGLFYSRKDHFWISDYKELASKLLELDQKYASEIYSITVQLIDLYENNYLYRKSNREEYEFEQLVELLGQIYNCADPKLKEEIVSLIDQSFDLVGRDIDYVLRNDNALFDILHDYVNSNIDKDRFEDKIEELIVIFTNDYKDEYKGLGSSYKGYELSSWSGNSYSVSDKKFLVRLLIPIFKELYIKYPEDLWNFLKTRILDCTTSVDDPDFLKRASIPILLQRFFSSKSDQSAEAKAYIKGFIEDTKGLPDKSDLLFQYIYNGEYEDDKVWELLNLYIKKYEIPYSPFVEKITTRLLSSDNATVKEHAKSQMIKWLYSEKYLKRALTWHGDVPTIIETLFVEFPDEGDKFFGHFVKTEWLKGIDRFDVYEYSRILHSLAQRNFPRAKEIIDAIWQKEELNVNQQVLITSGVFSITNREVSDEYLETLYEQYIDPLLSSLDDDIVKVSQRITHTNAREIFIDMAEEIARRKDIEDRVGKALRIIRVFVDDPEPYLPGKDPEDPNAEHSSHKSILEGRDVGTIHSVRGKCAWSLAVLVSDGAKPYIDEIVESADKLVEDPNYYILEMVSHFIEHLGASRLWVDKKGSTKLFWKDDKIEALQLAKKVEELAFKYLERITGLPDKAKIALVKPASLAFNHIRALNYEDSIRLLDLLEKFPSEVLHEFAAYYIFFAFHRKDSYIGWKHKSKGLYDDLDITIEQEQSYVDRLKSLLDIGDNNFMLNVLHMLERIIEESKTGVQKEKAIKIIKEMLQVYDTRVFSDVYMLVEKIITSDFDTAYDLYTSAIEAEYQFLKDMPEGKVDEIARLNYFYDFGLVLNSIHKKWVKKHS